MRRFAIVAMAANVLLWIALALGPPFRLGWMDSPTLLALLGGGLTLAVGGVLLTGWYRGRTTEASSDSPPEPAPAARTSLALLTAIAVTIAGALLLAGVITQKVDPLRASLVLLLGGAAFFIVLAAAEKLVAGGEVEVNSHWGGLGGSLGGWRISQTTVLIVVGLILVTATVTAGGLDLDGNDSANNQSADEGGENKADEKEAVGETDQEAPRNQAEAAAGNGADDVAAQPETNTASENAAAAAEGVG